MEVASVAVARIRRVPRGTAREARRHAAKVIEETASPSEAAPAIQVSTERQDQGGYRGSSSRRNWNAKSCGRTATAARSMPAITDLAERRPPEPPRSRM